jgi:hypothetical protein
MYENSGAGTGTINTKIGQRRADNARRPFLNHSSLWKAGRFTNQKVRMKGPLVRRRLSENTSVPAEIFPRHSQQNEFGRGLKW